MSFTQFILALQGRWKLVASALLACVIAMACLSFALPKQYTASASVLVEAKTGAIDPIAGVVLPGNNAAASTFMATQADVLTSERVVIKALRAVKAHENKVVQQQWRAATQGEGDFESWLAASVGRKIDVKPSRESNVINVSFTSPDRAFAAAMTNALVRAYIDTTLEMRVEPARQYTSFFDDRAGQLRTALEAAQNKLSDFQKSQGIISTDDRVDLETTKLAELSSQLTVLQSIANESRSRQKAAASERSRMSEVLGNSVVSTLTAEMARQDAKLQELRQRYGENHPQVQELQANIDQLRSRIDGESRKVAGSLTVSDDINSARLFQLKAEVRQQRERVLELKGLRDQAAVLLRDVESAQRAYDGMLTRVNQTSLESQNNQTNISVVKRATPPPLPSSPNVSLNMLLSVVLGLSLGILAATALEMGNPKLRGEDDVRLRLNQNLLAILPPPSKKKAVNSSKSRLLRLTTNS